MSREGSLDLIHEVQETLEIMKKTQQIKPVKVKSMLEHLRSSLEYVANDTYNKYNPSITTDRPKAYFPYNKQKFVDSFFTNILKVSPPSSSPLYKIFNSIQDYQTGDDWLVMMCNLTNEVKHRQPIPLEEDDAVKEVSVSVDGFGLVTANNSVNVYASNNYVNGKKVMDFTIQNGKIETTGSGIPLNIAITTEKKIRFHGVDYEVIPFIELCIAKLKEFINEAYDALDKI